MAILKITTNQTYELALKYKSGLPSKSRFNGAPQLMFTLSDGQILYLPEAVAKSISELNLAPQEPFLLTKNSTAGEISWTVERKPSGPQLVKSKTELLNELGGVLVTSTEPTAAPASPATAQPAQKPSNQPPSPHQFYLDRATKLIDVFAAAHKYAIEHYNGSLSKEDVRALVTTVFIQCTPKPQQNGTRY